MRVGPKSWCMVSTDTAGVPSGGAAGSAQSSRPIASDLTSRLRDDVSRADLKRLQFAALRSGKIRHIARITNLRCGQSGYRQDRGVLSDFCWQHYGVRN